MGASKEDATGLSSQARREAAEMRSALDAEIRFLREVNY
jgi:hypothetical protein